MNDDVEFWYNKFRRQMKSLVVLDCPVGVQKVTPDMRLGSYTEVFGSSEFNKDFKQKIQEDHIIVWGDEGEPTSSSSSKEEVEVVKDVFDPKNWGL